MNEKTNYSGECDQKKIAALQNVINRLNESVNIYEIKCELLKEKLDAIMPFDFMAEQKSGEKDGNQSKEQYALYDLSSQLDRLNTCNDRLENCLMNLSKLI